MRKRSSFDRLVGIGMVDIEGGSIPRKVKRGFSSTERFERLLADVKEFRDASERYVGILLKMDLLYGLGPARKVDWPSEPLFPKRKRVKLSK